MSRLWFPNPGGRRELRCPRGSDSRGVTSIAVSLVTVLVAVSCDRAAAARAEFAGVYAVAGAPATRPTANTSTGALELRRDGTFFFRDLSSSWFPALTSKSGTWLVVPSAHQSDPEFSVELHVLQVDGAPVDRRELLPIDQVEGRRVLLKPVPGFVGQANLYLYHTPTNDR